tara:strand:+ start:2558 stop:3721 length:1164 start_codon:yes stop_codon:yes gene_type:complete
MRIPFNKPPRLGCEEKYIARAIANDKLCGDGPMAKQCEALMEARFRCNKVLLTPSCTAALELAAILIEIKAGDEVIMPSYTFVSTANAFVLRGAKIVFVDIQPDTMNIDETLIERAITERTRAIVVVHYAGVSCDMDVVLDIGRRHSLFIIEDAAQAVMSRYKGKALGTLGHIGTYSFHETKNYTSGGEGGAIVLNDESLIERAEIIREKGTNRRQFINGKVDKYSWVDIGSSFLPSEIQAAYLLAQLDNADEINDARLKTYKKYSQLLKELSEEGMIQLPKVETFNSHNAHMFFIKVGNRKDRDDLIEHLSNAGINATFHYVPLHTSCAGKRFSRFNSEDKFTTAESEKLVRLPMYFGLSDSEVQYICGNIKDFFVGNQSKSLTNS